MINSIILKKMYEVDKLSMMQIANKLNCSHNQVVYWMKVYKINRRTISDAVYIHSNPTGDPFKMKNITSTEDAILFGLGIGIYWGEGNKLNKHSVRVANTDFNLINTFIRFLVEICGVDKSRLRFSLQVFSDIKPEEALNYWIEKLDVGKQQFGKVTVTPARSVGTYRRKNLTGVVIVNFHNYKLRDIIVELCRDSSVGRAQQW